jgi:glutamyl-tRNA reductase
VDPLASLVVASLRNGDAPIDARERLLDALPDAPLERAFVFATCHRVEIYAVVDGELDNAVTLTRLGIAEATAGLRLFRGQEAARHLFRVATGLDSLIQGESQVLGQLRRILEEAGLEGLLDALVRRAVQVARDIRARTALGKVTRSLGSLAVDEALRHVARPEDATILVIGAGEMGKLASRALSRRVRSLLVANRGEARALELARRVGAETVRLDEIDTALARVDAVISAADTRGSLLDAPRLGRRLAGGPLVVVDLAVPRSVAPDARGLRGLIYRSADDLRETAALPPEAIALAEGACATAAERFASEWMARTATPVIQALRARAEEHRRRQLARAMSKLGHLGERDREVVRALALSLTNTLLHEPTTALRAVPERADAARELFGLEEQPR